MECKHYEKLLSPYLENSLPLDERKAVKAHLDICQNCRSLMGFMQETIKSLSDFPKVELTPNLLNHLRQIPEKKNRFKLRFDFLLRPSLQPILAAATILLTLFSFYAFNPNRDQINRSVNRQMHLGFSKIEKLYARAESFTDSLGEYKDDIMVSLKNLNPLSGDEK